MARSVPWPRAGEGERAEELHAHARGAIELAGGGEIFGEAPRRAHGANGVRARRADTDLEELEEAGVHSFIVGVRWGLATCASVVGRQLSVEEIPQRARVSSISCAIWSASR